MPEVSYDSAYRKSAARSFLIALVLFSAGTFASAGSSRRCEESLEGLPLVHYPAAVPRATKVALPEPNISLLSTTFRPGCGPSVSTMEAIPLASVLVS